MNSIDVFTGVRIAGMWPTFHAPAAAAAAAPRKRRAAATAASVNRGFI